MKPGELHEQMERYLALRRAVGFEMQAEERVLRDFVIFAEGQAVTGTIGAGSTLDWACSTAPGCGRRGQIRRLSIARGFLAFVKASHPAVEVPAAGLLGTAPRSKPYIFSEAEVVALISAARRLGPAGSLRPHTVVTLIGLLVSTGLRASEAIRLQAGDVHLEAAVSHLQVRQTKFRKSRLVPLHRTTVNALRSYVDRRRSLGYDGLCGAFFVSERGRELVYDTVKSTFVTLVRRLGLRAPPGERQPSLHSLRHTFAVWRLTVWYREGADIQALLPALSVYLGHVKPQETYWYLTATPHLLGSAAKRFEDCVASGGEQRGPHLRLWDLSCRGSLQSTCWCTSA